MLNGDGRSGISVLVVDDDDDDLYIIQDSLRDIKETAYSIATAKSADAAMAKLGEQAFDLIVCDYRLGAVTGIEFIQGVRRAGIETPVILLTGLTDKSIDDAALAAGAADFVPKDSLNPMILDRAVRYALAHASRQKMLQAVLKGTNSGVAMVDPHNRVTLWNPRFAEFADAMFAEGDGLDLLAQLASNAPAKDIVLGDRTVERSCTDLPDGCKVLVLHDVTQRVNDLREREQAEQRIRHIALHDALTGLPNRAAFNELLEQSLHEARAANRDVAVLNLDLDRFKEVNDVFGHATGDALLKACADRIRVALSPTEYVARLGGDEFVVVQEAPTADSPDALARRIVATLSEPLEFHGNTVQIGLSVGIASFPAHGDNCDTLLAHADAAMYRAKSNPDRSVCTFDSTMDRLIRERRKIALELRPAIRTGGLALHFQPQIQAATGNVIGFEALVRWTSRSRGAVPPSEFIGIAEESGFVGEIDEWALWTACRIAATWASPLKIAVNISAKAICRPDVAAVVHGVLVETGLSPSRLELEVTETAFIHDPTRALHALRQIKALGVSIAMDDFGTGYSSLSTLDSFPFDRIKIDKSFVQGIGTSGRSEAICRAILGLGRVLMIPVLAEGVETAAQRDFIVDQGCEEIQGFLFGRPSPHHDMMSILAEMAAPALHMPSNPLSAAEQPVDEGMSADRRVGARGASRIAFPQARRGLLPARGSM